MCTVEKLLIKGIRSFSPDNQDVIEFFKPLTLIVGQNGAGKTTVIECLKQACTGELPPNIRSGQSFVHDPKVAGQTEVKAQIKLRFRTSTGQPVVVIRSFQLTQKKNALTFKSLDSVLQTMNKDTGEKQAITYKCADIDRIIPSLMGVSKAVLENVVFVHQEESNWPLADGITIKKKFDDIFAATKYTKALEALRKIRVEKVQQCKVDRAELAHLGTHKEHAGKLSAQLATAQAAQERLHREIAALEPFLQEQNEILQDVGARLEQIRALDNQVEHVKGKLHIQKETTATAWARLKDGDFEESNDVLEQYKRNCEAEERQLEGLIRQREAQIGAVRHQANDTRVSMKQMEASKNQLEAERLQHESRVEARDALLREAVSRGMVPLPDGVATSGPLPASAVTHLHGAVEVHAQQLENALAELKDKHKLEDVRMGEDVEKVNGQLVQLQAQAVNCEQNVNSNLRRMEQLGHQIASVMISTAALEEIKAQLDAAKTRLADKQRDWGAQNLDVLVQREDQAIRECTARIDALRQERLRATEATQQQQRLQQRRQDLVHAQERLAAGLAARRTRLLGLLGGAELPPLDGLRAQIEEVLRGKKREAQEASDKLRRYSAKSSSLQGELRTVQQELQRQEAALQAATVKVREGMVGALGVLEPDEAAYPGALSEREKKAQKSVNRFSKASSMLEVMAQFAEDVQEGGACPVCRRDFNEHERAVCLQFLDDAIQVLPDTLRQKEQQMAQLQREVAALRELQPQWVRRQELSDVTLPPLRERVQNLRQEVEAASAQVNETAELVAVHEHEAQDAAAVLSDVMSSLLPLRRQVEEVQGELQRLQASAAAAPSGRTVADVDADLSEAERGKDRHQREKDELHARILRIKDEEGKLATAIHKLEQRHQQGMQQMEQKLQFEAEVARLEQENTAKGAEVRQLRGRQVPLEAERERLQAVRLAARKAAGAAERQADESTRQAVKLRDNLQAALREIRMYQAQDKEGQLQRVQAEIAAAQQRVERLEEEGRQLEAENLKCREQTAQQAVIKGDIEDVLTWRRNREREVALEAELGRLREQIPQVGSPDDLNRALEAADTRLKELLGQQQRLGGELAVQESIGKEAKRDLGKAELRGIEDRYRQQQVKVKTTELASSDIDKYHKALEKALLAFHSSKMADINRIVKELWQKTYRGQDIDFIAIKADTDGTRSYNYRVVMYSGGAELDMRGRCSAGQKVLASLVIRLALAETFCLSCGILALDEPTTNLDAANSASLAEALASVMQSRAGQDNFQLIVITHDETFAQLIGTREHVEQLWRITKDERQHTSVRAERISD